MPSTACGDACMVFGEPLPLRRIAGGYLLQPNVGDLDALTFEDEFARAAALTAIADQASAVSLLHSASRHWRGDVLLGVEMGPFHPIVVRLNELRLAATEQRFAIELRLGRHREVVPDLAAAVATHPARETLVRYAMMALQAAGRTTEALDLFTRTRRVLREEIGAEPSATLVALRNNISSAGAAFIGDSLHAV